MKFKCKHCGLKLKKGARHFCKVRHDDFIVDEGDDFLVSTMFGFITDSWLLGWAFGGSPTGGMVGDFLNDADHVTITEPPTVQLDEPMPTTDYMLEKMEEQSEKICDPTLEKGCEPVSENLQFSDSWVPETRSVPNTPLDRQVDDIVETARSIPDPTPAYEPPSTSYDSGSSYSSSYDSGSSSFGDSGGGGWD